MRLANRLQQILFYSLINNQLAQGIIARFKCHDQVVTRKEIVLNHYLVSVSKAVAVCCVIHFTVVFPEKLMSGTNVYDPEIRVDQSKFIDFKWVFVKIGNVKSRQGISNQNF